MAKGKKRDKTPKPRPDKYAEKVAINVDFAHIMQVFADDANKTIEERIEEPNSEEANQL
jgi:hypothetical protein